MAPHDPTKAPNLSHYSVPLACTQPRRRAGISAEILGFSPYRGFPFRCYSPPIFRAIDQHGHLASRALTPCAVALIIKRCAAVVGLLPEYYSGHSLRAGFCATAAVQGAPHWKIKKVSGHKSNAVLDRYIRAARLFEDSPLEGMF